METELETYKATLLEIGEGKLETIGLYVNVKNPVTVLIVDAEVGAAVAALLNVSSFSCRSRAFLCSLGCLYVPRLIPRVSSPPWDLLCWRLTAFLLTLAPSFYPLGESTARIDDAFALY